MNSILGAYTVLHKSVTIFIRYLFIYSSQHNFLQFVAGGLSWAIMNRNNDNNKTPVLIILTTIAHNNARTLTKQ